MTPQKPLITDMASSVTPIFDQAVGRRLRIAREICKLHQRELAKSLSVSQRTVSGMERGIGGGRVAVPLKRFQVVFGPELAEYVVTGRHAAVFIPKHDKVMRELVAEKEKNRT